jgi:hypothetical protein
MQIIVNVVNLAAFLLFIPYLFFIGCLLILLVQKISNSKKNDDEYNFMYPFGISYDINYRKRTRRSKYDKFSIYLILLLSPLLVLFVNILGSRHFENQIKKEYPASWGVVIDDCVSTKVTEVNDSDESKLVKFENAKCACDAKVKSLYASSPYEYSKINKEIESTDNYVNSVDSCVADAIK